MCLSATEKGYNSSDDNAATVAKKDKNGGITMIKGCEKRVVWLRNTESEIFEQAYFILSESAYEKKKSEGDIVTEAKRIIGQMPVAGWWDEQNYKPKKRRISSASGKVACFILGFALGASPAAALLLIL